MTITSLRQIHGVGPSVETKLLSHFGSELAALSAIRNSQISEISSIDGIGERFALSLCRNLHYEETGEQIQDFLKTEDTIILYNRIIDIIAKYGNTFYSRSKLYLFFPLPITALDKIRKRQRLTSLGQEFHSLISKSTQKISEYDLLLNQLSPLKEHTDSIDTAARTIATIDKSIYNDLETNEVSQYCEILFIDDYERISEILSREDEVIWVGDDYLIDENLPNVISISESQYRDVNNLIPEKTLIFFAQNKKTLLAISEVCLRLTSIPADERRKYIGDLRLESIIEMGEKLKGLKETGEPDKGLNEEFNRLLKIVETFDSVLDEVLGKLNENLEKKLQDTTVKLEGEKILSLLKGISKEDPNLALKTGQKDLRDYLTDELYLAVEEIINRSELDLISRLNLTSEEIEYITGIFPRELKYPIDAFDDVKLRFIDFIRKKHTAKAFELKVSLAKVLGNYKSLAKTALERFLELDYLIMIGKFSNAYNLVLPNILEDKGTGFFIQNSKNLFLLQQELQGKLKVEPVSYGVGEIGKLSNEVKGERIVLLSGANSGGKTTLLLSVAVIAILSQMGLPVPCSKAIIGGFKELHYYRKSSGHVNAGAFESTLRMLSQMILSPNSRLVLADEMESISEPGASARVIAAFLDLLGRSSDSVGVFVTHLALEIGKYCKNDLRIDGIEARGLSDNLELLVDRTPQYYRYAKSTPELIVQRLQHISKGSEKDIYSYILEAFKS